MDFKALCAERAALYAWHQAPGEPIPIRVDPLDIDDTAPLVSEVANACRELRLGKANGPSGISPEHLRAWLTEYEREGGDPTLWQRVLDIVKIAFTTGELPRALSLSILELIPKPCGDNRGIGLLEPIWNLIEKIIDRRLNRCINFVEGLHGFRSKHGCGTAIIECKMEQLEALLKKGQTLFQVFLDLTKAYDTLDRTRTLEILEGYGVGPNIRRILDNFWDKLQLCASQGGYYSRDIIDSERGVTQGGIASPTILKIVIDAIVREWIALKPGSSLAAFYADDGCISGSCCNDVQSGVEIITDLFARVGLKINASKTKAMVSGL